MEIYLKYALETIKYEKLANYREMEQASCNLYNYFTHNPQELINTPHYFDVGLAFFLSLGFDSPDSDIQEVKAENAFYCLYKSFQTDVDHIGLAATCLFVLMHTYQQYLRQLIMRNFGAPEFNISGSLLRLPNIDGLWEIYMEDLTTDQKLSYIKEHLTSFFPQFLPYAGFFNSPVQAEIYNRAKMEFKNENLIDYSNREKIAHVGSILLKTIDYLVTNEIKEYCAYRLRR